MITDVLADYKEIYDRYPATAYLSKAGRKERHIKLTEWAAKDYPVLPDIEGIKAFMQKNPDLKFERPFFLKVAVPCVQKDIDSGDLKSLRFLFECNETDDFRIGTDRDYVNLFCEGANYKYNAWALADMVLSKEPDNEIVLYYKYRSIKRVLEYSIHEVPSGVLSGVDGANKEDIPGMLKRLHEFAAISKKLGKDDGRLIQICETMYEAYGQYLGSFEEYAGFEDYLIRHNIPY